MTVAAGSRLGPYEIVAPLGAGGMGEVYRARDTRLRREVAVKVLPASLSQDPDRLRRFEQEARAASALNHPGILTIHDFGEHQAPRWAPDVPMTPASGTRLGPYEIVAPLGAGGMDEIGQDGDADVDTPWRILSDLYVAEGLE